MIYFYLLGCLSFLFLQAFFAAVEISVISSSIFKLRHRKEQGDVKAAKVYQLLNNPERFLATTLVGINFSLVLSSSFLTFLFIHSGIHRSNFWATLLFTPLVVIFSELIPKNIGRHFREDFSCVALRIFYFFEKLLSPIVNSIEAVSKFLIDTFVGRVRRRSLFVTKDEIKYLVREIEHQGGIDKGEKEAIDEVFEFRRSKIRDICVRLSNFIVLDYNDTCENILEAVKKHGFTRYPVRKSKEIIGYINVYDLFYNPKNDWQSFIRPIAKIGYNQRLYEALAALKAKRENIVLVFKGKKPYGIITLEDLMREIIVSIVKI
jgi:putative hemolysin